MSIFDRAKDAIYSPIAKTTAHYIREMARNDLEKGLARNDGMVLGPPVRRSALAANNYDSSMRRKPGSSVSFEVLRRFAQTHEVSRICINRRKRQISSLEWDIVSVDPHDKADYRKDIELIRAYFKNLGGYRVRFRELQDTLIEDLLVLDALCAYKQRDRGGNILYYMAVDGATIKLRVDEQGNTPEPPEVAYRQYINGTMTGEFTADEMIYEMMNPRTSTPYGLAPLESLILIVQSALKGTLYNLDFLTEGNIPEGFLQLPETWSQKQIAEYMDYFDALVSGDSAQQNKIKAVPGGAGTGYIPTKKRDDMAFKEFNEWLLKITCAMFDIQPQEIGFTMDSNRSNSKEQGDITNRSGILPLANLLTEIYNDIIQIDLGFPNLKFKYYGLEDRDQVVEAEVQKIHVQAGIRTIDEIRKDDLTLEPLGISQPYVLGQATFLTPTMIANDMETDNYDDEQNDVTATEAHNSTTQESSTTDLVPGKTKSATSDDEFKRLEKYAVRRLKLGKAYRPFESDVLEKQVVAELNNRLSKTTRPEAVKTIVDTYRRHGEPLFLDKAADNSGDDYQHNVYFDTLIETPQFAKFKRDFEKAIKAQAKWTAAQIQELETKYIGEDLRELTVTEQANLKAYLNNNLPPITDFIDSQTALNWYIYVTSRAVNDLYVTLGSAVKFDLKDSMYIASLDNQVNELLTKSSLDNTTRKQLANLIIDARKDGKTVPEISRMITDKFKDISKVRAKMIAYTETAGTLNRAQFTAMQKVGVQYKEWLGLGPNICPICLMNVGDGSIPMDSFFSSGDLMPEAHVMCECALDYVTTEISLADLWDGEEQ